MQASAKQSRETHEARTLLLNPYLSTKSPVQKILVFSAILGKLSLKEDYFSDRKQR